MPGFIKTNHRVDFPIGVYKNDYLCQKNTQKDGKMIQFPYF